MKSFVTHPLIHDPMLKSADELCGTEVRNKRPTEGINVFTSSVAFWKHLPFYDFVDVMTFSYDDRAVEGINLRRLLYTKSNQDPRRPVIARKCVNLHAKVYLCYRNNRVVEVFVGSWNLTYPSFLYDVIVRVDRKARKVLQESFETIWNQCEKHEAL